MTKVANRAEGRRAAMRAAGLLLGAIFGAFAVSGQAVACMFIPKLIEFNGGVWYRADGSFGNAGEDDRLRGKAIQDLGNGRVMQVLRETATCFSGEEVLLADCTTPDVLVLYDWGEPTNPEELEVMMGSYDASSLLPPNGLLGQVLDQPIREMAAYAVEGGAKLDNGILAANMKAKRRDRWDPYKGCKIFYPDSAGAKQKKP